MEVCSWENHLFLWVASIAMLNSQSVVEGFWWISHCHGAPEQFSIHNYRYNCVLACFFSGWFRHVLPYYILWQSSSLPWKPRPVRIDDLPMEDGAFPQQTGSRRELISSEGLANGWDDFQEHPNCSRLSCFWYVWIKNDWSFDDWAHSHGYPPLSTG